MTDYENDNRRDGEERRRQEFPIPEGWKIIDRRQTERREENEDDPIDENVE